MNYQSNYFSEQELKDIGFKQFGENCSISRKTSIYGVSSISLGNNVRIDDFCILSGDITIKNNVHVGAGTYLFAGTAGIDINDYVGFSSRCVVYAVSDDYSGKFLTNPTIPDKYRKVTAKKVIINKHCIIGTGTTILPGVTLAEGCCIGAMSMATKSTLPWKVYFGIPAAPIKNRKQDLLALEEAFINEQK
jgi:acetyltransferase-like isoleucine patch superfamily enzyme